MSDLKLMRMQVPMNWSVCDNKFYDVDPVVDADGFIENWSLGFIEDVLWIREHQHCSTFPDYNYFSIDLGWYPDSSSNGAYMAKLHWNAEDKMHLSDSFSSKDRFEIREKLEYWMGEVTRANPDKREEIKNLGEG